MDKPVWKKCLVCVGVYDKHLGLLKFARILLVAILFS